MDIKKKPEENNGELESIKQKILRDIFALIEQNSEASREFDGELVKLTDLFDENRQIKETYKAWLDSQASLYLMASKIDIDALRNGR